MWRSTFPFVLSLVPLAACGSGGASAPPPTTAEAAEAEPRSSDAVATREEPAPAARKRKPFEIHSQCGDVVTVVFGDDPKAQDAGSRTIAPSSSIEGPRDADGNQTVWLLDAENEPLIKVHVTRGMKRVEIGRSCRTLDAR